MLDLLIDTNVILDVLLARQPWAADAVRLFDAVERGTPFPGFLAEECHDLGRFGNGLLGIGIFPAAVGVPFCVAFREVAADYAIAKIFPLLLGYGAAAGNIPAEIEVRSLVTGA